MWIFRRKNFHKIIIHIENFSLFLFSKNSILSLINLFSPLPRQWMDIISPWQKSTKIGFSSSPPPAISLYCKNHPQNICNPFKCANFLYRGKIPREYNRQKFSFHKEGFLFHKEKWKRERKKKKTFFWARFLKFSFFFLPPSPTFFQK